MTHTPPPFPSAHRRPKPGVSSEDQEAQLETCPDPTGPRERAAITISNVCLMEASIVSTTRVES